MSSILETLSSYVPNLILRRIIKNPEPITAPTYESFPAAVLYADITGFTALTERLEGIPHAQQGAGAEAVTNAINAYFDQFIEVLHAHGGDIVKFTGDGVLAIWATETNLPAVQIASALRDAVRRASQCGLAVQQALENYQTADGISLSMRIGIGAGDVSVVHLGGVFNRWEVLVGGDPVVQSHTAESKANPGEVILSPHAYRLIRAFANGTPLTFERNETGDPSGGEGVGLLLSTILEPLAPRELVAIKLEPEMEAALRPYIPAAVLTRLDAGQSAWLSELRRVTVLFINLPDLNNFTASALDKAQLALRELQRTIYKQQGSLNKLNVDEKGATVVAALGLPPLSHADDPERGAKAGFETVQILKTLGLKAYVGIATGLTFSGVIGSDQRREYTMMGDTVNLAARLMQATKNPENSLNPEGGPVLCDMNTYTGANTGLQFETIPAVKVKGKRQPIPVFQPLRVRSSPIVDRHDEWARALVGRAEERFTVAEQLQELQRGGAGGVFVIEGEAGIGKSRLVKEIIEQAKALGIITYLGQGDVVDRENLYHVWQPIFRQILEVDELSSTAGNRPIKKIVRLLSDPEILRFYPLVSEVLDVKIEENEFTAQMEGQVRANNTRQLLVRIFEEVCKQSPTVLLLEDTQWMDTASWALLHDVWSKIHPLLIVLATRPVEVNAPKEYLQILDAPLTRRLRLTALSPSEVKDLICRCLDVATVPDVVVRLIQQKAEGHPFFSQELAYALRDGQFLRFENGDCKVAANVDLESLSFPNTVQGVITSRIDSLPPAQQLLLKVASVIGRSFEFHPLHDVYPVTEDKPRLKHHLRILEELDITDLEISDPNLVYMFKHNITQEVSYALLPFSMRQQFHRQIAEWYENQFKDDLSPYYLLLAHHWSNAEVAEKAVEFYEKTGEKALRGGAYQEAISAFTQALAWDQQIKPGAESPKMYISWQKSITAQDFRRARWERQIGQAYIGLGEIPTSHEHLKHALVLLGRPENTKPIPLASYIFWQILKQIYFRLLPDRIANLPESGLQPVLEAARVYSLLAENYFYLKQNGPLMHAAIRTLNLTERVGQTPELATAYANMGMLMGVIPIHRFARFYFKRALATAQALDLRPPLAYVNLIISLYSLGTGAWDQVHVAIEDAIRLYRELGDQRRLGEALSLKAIRLHFLGQFHASNQVYQELNRMGENSGDIQQITWGLDGQATNLLRLGKLKDALALLEKTQPLFEKSNDRAEETVYYGTLAVLRLYIGDPAAARLAADKALTLGTGDSPVYSALEGYAGTVETYLTLWENNPTAQNSLASQALQALKALQGHASRFPFGHPRALIWQGMYEWLTERQDKAFRSWKKAIEASQKMNLPYEEGLAHYQISRHTAKNDPVYREHLAKAREIFHALEVRYPDVTAI
ncbi:MAG: adenylate/guanylate cyclase domain-containing protein [Anaerolineales bacterium]